MDHLAVQGFSARACSIECVSPMLKFWRPEPTDPASILVFVVGGLAFLVALIVVRLRRGATGAGDRRSLRSMVGVVVQSVAIGLVGGRVVASGPMFPLANPPRTLAVAVAMAAAVGLFAWSAQTMGRNWAIVARTRADHELVTGGPFAWVRNPIYVAMAFFMVAMALATGHTLQLVAAAPLFLIGTLIRTTEEERLLRAHFGVAYDQYAARVKRFVPWVV